MLVLIEEWNLWTTTTKKKCRNVAQQNASLLARVGRTNYCYTTQLLVLRFDNDRISVGRLRAGRFPMATNIFGCVPQTQSAEISEIWSSVATLDHRLHLSKHSMTKIATVKSNKSYWWTFWWIAVSIVSFLNTNIIVNRTNLWRVYNGRVLSNQTVACLFNVLQQYSAASVFDQHRPESVLHGMIISGAFILYSNEKKKKKIRWFK